MSLLCVDILKTVRLSATPPPTHSLTHSLTGQQYDKNGILRKWWTNSSQEAFKERQICFEQQYSQYEMYGYNVSEVVYLSPSFQVCERNCVIVCSTHILLYTRALLYKQPLIYIICVRALTCVCVCLVRESKQLFTSAGGLKVHFHRLMGTLLSERT